VFTNLRDGATIAWNQIMNSLTERRAFSGSEKNDRGRAGRRRQILRLGLTLALTLATVASAQTYTVLKSFTGSDGGWPSAGLVAAGSTLYGTTWWGGNSIVFPGLGVVFKVNTDGSGYAVLKNFSGSDGMIPIGGLVLSGSTLYGTTEYGGSSRNPTNNSGYGVVFKVNTDGSGYAVLKNFTGSDGQHPVARLVLAGSTLYGTTAYGGSSYNRTNDGYGVVFKVNTDGSGDAVLKSFSGSDGVTPFAGLVLAGSTLYGTTEYGGSSYNPPNNYGYGVVFKVNTDGTGYTMLKSFSDSDGANPVMASLTLSGTTLYGTAAYGGSSLNSNNSGYGVVFKVNTNGSGYAVLKNFTGSD
jgi:uncharacterized repeat protein (TIGR03803 family)